MTESDSGLSGYAGIISRALLPLNRDAAFRERFARRRGTFILDSPHWSHAALIVVDRGSLSVRGIGKDRADAYRLAIGQADGYLLMGTFDYLAFAGKRLGLRGILRKWLAGKIRVRKPFGLLQLLRVYRFSKAPRLNSPRSLPVQRQNNRP